MSRFALSAYPTGRPTRRCALSGRELAVGEPYTAALLELPDGKLERRDFAADAWPVSAPKPVSLPPGAALVGSWRATVPSAEPGKAAAVQLADEDMLELVQQLGTPVFSNAPVGSSLPAADAALDPASASASSEPRRAGLRYVLALILLRKKLLIADTPSRATAAKADPSSLWVRPKGVPAPPEGPPLIEIKDPGLSETGLAEILADLESLTSGESGPTPANAPASLPAAPPAASAAPPQGQPA